MPAKAVAPATNPATASQPLALVVDTVAVAPTALFGWCLCESTGSEGASVRLHDGDGTDDPALTSLITLSANESTRDWFGDQSIEVFSGQVFLEVVSGSVEAVVYLA